MALCCFKVRREHPKSIRRDNWSNFKEPKDALSKLDQKKIINELNKNRIQWMFKPPKSPWMGTTMEALVKITITYLKAVVKDCLNILIQA